MNRSILKSPVGRPIREEMKQFGAVLTGIGLPLFVYSWAVVPLVDLPSAGPTLAWGSVALMLIGQQFWYRGKRHEQEANDRRAAVPPPPPSPPAG